MQAQDWAPFAEGRNRLFQNQVLLGIAVLAKTVRPERMVENLALFDFNLDEADMAAIATLETGASSFFSHRDPAIIKWMSERKLDI